MGVEIVSGDGEYPPASQQPLELLCNEDLNPSSFMFCIYTDETTPGHACSIWFNPTKKCVMTSGVKGRTFRWVVFAPMPLPN